MCVMRFLPLILLFACLTQSVAQERTAFTSEQLALFNDEVVGLLKSNCLKCHSGNEPKGGLDLTRRDSILTGGDSGSAADLKDPHSSILLKAINYKELQMPPTGQMSARQIAILTKWVEQGLPWPAELRQIAFELNPGPPEVNEDTKKFWSFQPVRKPVPPSIPAGWGNNEIDAFIFEKLKDADLSPSPRANPRQLIRRAYYDLTGLPPSIEAVEAFAANPSPEAWSGVIEELLESPHYGEQWGRHWLDLVRYAETNSYERDGAKPHVWRYRDYVIQSFNSDKPYDRFVTEQLAGDEIADRTTDSLIATGFYRLGRWDDEPVDPELAFYDDLDDILTTSAQTFLGLTINCARCHDHKIDPIPQKDYYRMLAFFQPLRRYGVRSHESVMEASVVQIDQPEDSNLHAAAVAQYERELNGVMETLARLDEKLRPDLNGVEKDEFQDEVNRVRLAEKRAGGLFSAKEVEQYRNVTNRRNYLREHRPSGLGQALCVKEDLSHIRPAHVLLRGSPHAPGDAVTPGFPSVLSPPEVSVPEIRPDATTSGRRAVLAQWITSQENPLTSRVMANRIWQFHFGRGIVRTSSDFGFQGTRPMHPELLDWLAATFIERGWSIKSMHRLIMNSATYQMTSASREDAYAKDPENHLWWRMDMRRLTAEEIRDSILWANGTLNANRMYGPSIYTKIPDEVKAGQSQPGSGWGNSSPEDQARRSIYIHVKRSLLDPVLESFDMADTDQTCPVRFSTTQPTQALGMLNSDFVLEQAEIFSKMIDTAAAGVKKSGKGSNDESAEEQQVRIALQRVLQRSPESDEIQRGVSLIRTLQTDHHLSLQQAQKYFCLMALNLNEFIYLD